MSEIPPFSSPLISANMRRAREARERKRESEEGEHPRTPHSSVPLETLKGSEPSLSLSIKVFVNAFSFPLSSAPTILARRRASPPLIRINEIFSSDAFA